jgi:hypothetical protein
LSGFQYYTQYIKYKAALAGIKVKCQKQVLNNIAENAIRKVYERYKDCLPVLNVVKRTLIEMPLSILPIGL